MLAVAVLLGLRHAADPDHIAAVTTLVTGESDGRSGHGTGRRAALRIGGAWGIGHAAALVAFGLPAVLFGAALPDGVQRALELLVGLVVAALAARLLVRWWQGRRPAAAARGAHPAHGTLPRAARTPVQAFAVGLLHGAGGSAAIGVLLLASIGERWLAAGALVLFAGCTALSMAALTALLSKGLAQAGAWRPLGAVAVPALGAASLALGTLYALDALALAPAVL